MEPDFAEHVLYLSQLFELIAAGRMGVLRVLWDQEPFKIERALP